MYRDQTIEKPHAKKNPVLATRQPRKLRVDDGCVESEAHIPYSRFPLYHGAGKLRCQTFYSCRVVVLAWLGTSKFESIDRVSVPKNLRVPKNSVASKVETVGDVYMAVSGCPHEIATW